MSDSSGIASPTDSVWRPARRERLSEDVANQLRAAILAGELRPGSRLVEAAIAEKIGVSKSPVREAIRMLASEGIVVATRRRGAYVRGMTEKDAREIRVLRETLESLSVALAMEDIDPEWLARLDELAAGMRAATDRAQLLELHVAFHQELTGHSRNERLGEFLAILSVQTRAIMPFIDMVSGGREIETLEHEAIVAAIRAGDVGKTQAIISEHIRPAADQLEAMWRTDRRSPSPGSDPEAVPGTATGRIAGA